MELNEKVKRIQYEDYFTVIKRHSNDFDLFIDNALKLDILNSSLNYIERIIYVQKFDTVARFDYLDFDYLNEIDFQNACDKLHELNVLGKNIEIVFMGEKRRKSYSYYNILNKVNEKLDFLK